MKLAGLNMFKYIIIAALFVGINAIAAPYISDGVVRGGGQSPLFKNFAPNPFAEKNVLGWTYPDITVSRDTDAADKLNGVSSFELNPNAVGTFTSSAMTLDNDVIGNCEAQVLYKGNASTWDFALVANDGTTVLTEVRLTNASAWTMASLNYPCASDYKLQMQSTDGVYTINAGNFYWGKATNVTSATPVTGWTAYTPSFDASFGSVTNKNFEYQRIADMLHVRGSFTTGTTTTGNPIISIPSGLTFNTTTPGVTISSNKRTVVGHWNRDSSATPSLKTGTVVIIPGIVNNYVYLSIGDYDVASSPYGAPNTNAVYASGENGTVEFAVKVNEWSSSQTAVTVENTDTDWVSYTPTFEALGTVSSIDMKWRRNGPNIEIKGSWTNGTVTGSTATFTLPAGLSSAYSSHKIVGNYGSQGSAGSGLDVVWNSSLGKFTFGTANWQSFATGTQLASSGFTSVNLSMPISGWTKTASAPLLVGSVTNPGGGIDVVGRAYLSYSTGTPVLSNTNGNWISVASDNGTGDTTFTIAAGVFSGTPSCQPAVVQTNGFPRIEAVSSTSLRISTLTVAASPAAVDAPYYLTCVGPR